MITKLEIINISIAAIIKLLENELIYKNYPHNVIEYVFKRDKEILLFFGKSILENLKILEKKDIKSKPLEIVIKSN